MAYAETTLMQERQVRELAGEHWLPVNGTGAGRRVPLEGTLNDLCGVYERFKNRLGSSGIDPDTRPAVYGIQTYQRAGQSVRPCAGFTLLTLDGSDRLACDSRKAMVVAAWLRHGSAQALIEEGESEEWINQYVHGHNAEGIPGRQMSFVPLSTIGHSHADGRIRRVLLTEPPGSPGQAVDLLRIKLAGLILTDDNGKGTCQLARLDDQDGVWQLYVRRARIWRTVTPMVLHGHNALRGKISIHKTERLLLEALDKSGYPPENVESVVFQPAPLWPGGLAAREIQVPKHLERWPRYHIQVRFREPVQGPVLAGIGRHCGIGVFAAPWAE
jgi:CRISPR-associated protein Csb2